MTIRNRMRRDHRFSMTVVCEQHDEFVPWRGARRRRRNYSNADWWTITLQVKR